MWGGGGDEDEKKKKKNKILLDGIVSPVEGIREVHESMNNNNRIHDYCEDEFYIQYLKTGLVFRKGVGFRCLGVFSTDSLRTPDYKSRVCRNGCVYVCGDR